MESISNKLTSQNKGIKIVIGIVLALVLYKILATGIHGLRYFIHNPNEGMHPILILGHIGTGFIALILGPFQFWKFLRKNYLKVHRFTGRVYMVAFSISSFFGLYMGITTHYGPVFGSGITMLALVWMFTGTMGYLEIRNKNIENHRLWMIRNYVVTLAFVTYRIGTDLMIQMDFSLQDSLIMSWLCWVPQLLLVEYWIQLTQQKQTITTRARQEVTNRVQ